MFCQIRGISRNDICRPMSAPGGPRIHREYFCISTLSARMSARETIGVFHTECTCQPVGPMRNVQLFGMLLVGPPSARCRLQTSQYSGRRPVVGPLPPWALCRTPFSLLLTATPTPPVAEKRWLSKPRTRTRCASQDLAKNSLLLQLKLLQTAWSKVSVQSSLNRKTVPAGKGLPLQAALCVSWQVAPAKLAHLARRLLTFLRHCFPGRQRRGLHGNGTCLCGCKTATAGTPCVRFF